MRASKERFFFVGLSLLLCGYILILLGSRKTPKLSPVKQISALGKLYSDDIRDEVVGNFQNGSTYEKVQNNLSRTGRRQFRSQKREVGDPLVTMFTTIRDRDCRRAIHNRLINNWAALSPALHPVLFVPSTERNSSWIDRASANNWTVRILYALRHNLPILKAMFKDVLAVSSTPFVGYANADILFDRSLIATLRYLKDRLDVVNQMILVVGRRRNVDVEKLDLGSGSNFTMIGRMDSVKPFHGHAQDYFIVSRRGLPWEEIPDFVVGRNGYDNWLVVMAQRWNITLIDASRTVLALHQLGKDGIYSRISTVSRKTVYLNANLVKGFSYRRGSFEFAPLYTEGQCTTLSRLGNSDHCIQINNMTLSVKLPSGDR